MGFDESRNKKKFLKTRFRSCYVYFKDHDDLARRTCKKRPDTVALMDGSIVLEEAISTLSHRGMCTGRQVAKTLVQFARPYTDAFANVVLCFDRPNRPPFKDIDTSRSYDKDAPLFKSVDDDAFPRAKDARVVRLNSLNRQLVKLEKMQKSHESKAAKLEARIARMKRAKKLDVAKIEKLTAELREARRQVKTPGAIKFLKNRELAERLGISAFIGEERKAIEREREEIKRRAVDVWSTGKGNPKNRAMVMGYLGRAVAGMVQKVPPQHGGGHCLTLDGVHTKGGFGALNVARGGGGRGKTTVTSWGGSQLGEGEQAIMYFIARHGAAGHKNFLVFSTDTDTYTYIGLLYYMRQDLDVRIATKNFYAGRVNRLGDTVENYVSRCYVVNMKRMCAQIYRENGNDPEAVLNTFVLLGIYMGCDFTDNMHKVLQRNLREDTTRKFLGDLLSPKVLGLGIVSCARAPDGRYAGGTRYDVRVSEQKLQKLFPRAPLKKLATAARNAEFVAGYMMNQWRAAAPGDRAGYGHPDCCAVDARGASRWGYARSAENKVVLSKNPSISIIS